MRIEFEDSSFIEIDDAVYPWIATITMCGISSDGKKTTMSSSKLTKEQVQDLIDALKKLYDLDS